MALRVRNLGGHMAGAVEGIDLSRWRDAGTLGGLCSAAQPLRHAQDTPARRWS